MARKFSFPEVQTMEVGDFDAIYRPRSEVTRKVNLYAGRVGKAFAITDDRDGANQPLVIVTRLPDPVKEAA